MLGSHSSGLTAHSTRPDKSGRLLLSSFTPLLVLVPLASQVFRVGIKESAECRLVGHAGQKKKA